MNNTLDVTKQTLTFFAICVDCDRRVEVFKNHCLNCGSSSILIPYAVEAFERFKERKEEENSQLVKFDMINSGKVRRIA